MIGAGPRLGLGLGHGLAESVDALALALDEVRLRSRSIRVLRERMTTFSTRCRSIHVIVYKHVGIDTRPLL